MFRGMFKFPCFNVIQSTCFDTVSRLVAFGHHLG